MGVDESHVCCATGLDTRQAFQPDVARAVNVALRILGRVLPPLYHLNLLSVSAGLILAATFFGLLVMSGVPAWRASPIQ